MAKETATYDVFMSEDIPKECINGIYDHLARQAAGRIVDIVHSNDAVIILKPEMSVEKTDIGTSRFRETFRWQELITCENCIFASCPDELDNKCYCRKHKEWHRNYYFCADGKRNIKITDEMMGELEECLQTIPKSK